MNHSDKNEWDPLEEDPPMWASGSTKVELRCRVVTGGGGKATTKKTYGHRIRKDARLVKTYRVLTGGYLTAS